MVKEGTGTGEHIYTLSGDQVDQLASFVTAREEKDRADERDKIVSGIDSYYDNKKTDMSENDWGQVRLQIMMNDDLDHR